jgi:hypothetical protein
VQDFAGPSTVGSVGQDSNYKSATQFLIDCS